MNAIMQGYGRWQCSFITNRHVTLTFPVVQRVGQPCPLLSWRQWESLLSDCGFVRPNSVRGKDGGQAVIMALGNARLPDRMDAAARRGTYIVTGGLGGLGLLTARVLVKECVPRLITLLSLSGRARTGSEVDWTWLTRCGVQLQLSRCNVSDKADVQATMLASQRVPLRLHGVFHLASVFGRQGVFLALAVPTFQWMYGPKVHGANLLHGATFCKPLRLFMLCSSAASLCSEYCRCLPF